MIGDKKVVAVIAARGGSKGLPGKNVRMLGGRPLLAWSIAAAGQSEYVDDVCVTSDDAEILNVTTSFDGVIPLNRPSELATDTAKIEDAILHALDSLTEDYDLLVLLQPTSPLRVAADIDGAIRKCVSLEAPAAVSVTSPSKSPYWMCTVNEDGTLRRLLEYDETISRRQDLPAVYAFNGAVYVAHTGWFRENRTFVCAETVAYTMPPERSVDIDTELDFLYVETLLGKATSGSLNIASEIL